MKRTPFLLVGIGFLLFLAYFVFFDRWQKGWVVAEVPGFQVRKVPVRDTGVPLPLANSYYYVIEKGSYPYTSTFCLFWDSYEAKRIAIHLPQKHGYEVEVRFDEHRIVRGHFGGSTQSAYWTEE